MPKYTIFLRSLVAAFLWLLPLSAQAQESLKDLSHRLARKEAELRRLEHMHQLESEIRELKGNISERRSEERRMKRPKNAGSAIVRPDPQSYSVATALVETSQSIAPKWSGFWLGATTSVWSARPQWRQFPQTCAIIPNCSRKFNNDQLLGNNGGIRFGVNHQIGSFVFGADASVEFSRTGKKAFGFYYAPPPFWVGPWDGFGFRHAISSRAATSLNAKFGYTIHNIWLYGIGGMNITRFTVANVDSHTPPNFYGKASRSQWGTNVGFGTEYKISSDWSIALELMRTVYRKKAYLITGFDGLGDDSYWVTMKPSQNVIRFGLNYRFATW